MSIVVKLATACLCFALSQEAITHQAEDVSEWNAQTLSSDWLGFFPPARREGRQHVTCDVQTVQQC